MKLGFTANYLIFAVSPEDATRIEEAINEIVDINVLHMVFYQNKPSAMEIDSLFRELDTDRSLGMVDKDFDLFLAAPSQFEMFAKRFLSEDRTAFLMTEETEHMETRIDPGRALN